MSPRSSNSRTINSRPGKVMGMKMKDLLLIVIIVSIFMSSLGCRANIINALHEVSWKTISERIAMFFGKEPKINIAPPIYNSAKQIGKNDHHFLQLSTINTRNSDLTSEYVYVKWPNGEIQHISKTYADILAKKEVVILTDKKEIDKFLKANETASEMVYMKSPNGEVLYMPRGSADILAKRGYVKLTDANKKENSKSMQ